MWQVLLNYDLPPSEELKPLCEKVFYFNTELRRIQFLYDTPESAASQIHTIGILSKLDSKDNMCKKSEMIQQGRGRGRQHENTLARLANLLKMFKIS
jgi:hypothetical protein